MKVEIWHSDFLQKDTGDKMLRTYRQVMAPLEGLISLGIRSKNQTTLAQLFRIDNCWLNCSRSCMPFTA